MNTTCSELSREQYVENVDRGNALGGHMLKSDKPSFYIIKKGGTMGAKKVKYDKQGIGQLPNDKPVLYRIETKSGGLNYAGIARRGRVQERLSEHLSVIPGASVRIEQFSSIKDAEKKESNVIKRNKPKYNIQERNPGTPY